MIIPTDKQLRKRDDNDYYPTPIELCVSALGLLPDDFKPFSILDPGAGDGVWGRAFRYLYGSNPYLFGVEKRDVPFPQDYTVWRSNDDYLEHNFPIWAGGYDLIMGNPPYKIAEEFIDKSLQLVKDGGYILFLFRLAFLESKRRYDKYWNNIKPKEVSVLVNRISFTGDKKSDDTAYALYLWQKGYIGDTKLTWLKWR